MRVAISFDYDSPAGYKESFGPGRDLPCDADYRGTEALLKVLAKHDVQATFAIVGCVALDGAPPECCPGQIREIHAAGHEVASHSMYHRFIPPMTDRELAEDVKLSKMALEACIGQSIRGFIPPFNRPAHFPRRGAFSFSEVLGLHGRGRGRQSVNTMLATLNSHGFGWCRVSFRSTLKSLTEKIIVADRFPPQPFVFENMVVMPLHATGFGEATLSLLRRYLDSDHVLTVYAHPNKAHDELDENGVNDERAEVMDAFLTRLERERALGRVEFCTMAQVECQVRAISGPLLQDINSRRRRFR
ncbi:MAG: polysaccharide deacetylase family protein [Candidatus Solibacter sp.]